LDSGWQGKPDLSILSAGEALSRPLAEQLLQKTRAVWNGYGPTEISIGCTLGKVESGDGPVLIGYPMPNTLHYVVDANAQPVPVGVPGELYVGGVGVARGYLQNPQLTTERFIPNPFGPGRVYRTGDRVRWRSDGQLEFLGRADDQVKLRGFRIELGEIEAVLQRYPGLKAACVMAREDVPGERFLVAYYIAEPGGKDCSHELREFLRRHLPDYMVPARFISLEAFPLTPNGKVDRRALPAPGPQARAAHGSAPLQTPMQQLVAEVWEAALGVRGLGLEDNFYDLGGHSLLSVQVIKELQQRTGVQVHPGVMVFQSLGQLAAYYEHHAKPSQKDGPMVWMDRLSSALAKVLGGA
jgi:hypothetical protein